MCAQAPAAAAVTGNKEMPKKIKGVVIRMLYRKMPNGEELSALGFGLMRLPLKDKKIDEARAEAQVKRSRPVSTIWISHIFITTERARSSWGR